MLFSAARVVLVVFALFICFSVAFIQHKSISRGLLLSKGMSSLADDSEDDMEDRVGAPAGPLPSVSSKINFATRVLNPTVDLWIVGSGTLGTLVTKIWKAQNPSAVVVAETKTSKRHDELLSYGAIPTLRDQRNITEQGLNCRNVLICLPPSGASNYEEELFGGSMLWAGPEFGNLIFTSSTAVYGEKSNTVTEDFRLDSRSARSMKYNK